MNARDTIAASLESTVAGGSEHGNGKVIVRVRTYTDPTPVYAMAFASLLRWQASHALRAGDHGLFDRLATVASDYCTGSFK